MRPDKTKLFNNKIGHFKKTRQFYDAIINNFLTRQYNCIEIIRSTNISYLQYNSKKPTVAIKPSLRPLKMDYNTSS